MTVDSKKYMADFITDKKEIVKRVREYLKENNLVELMDFCRKNCPDTHRHTNFVRDVAHLMRRSGDFEISVNNENDNLICSITVWPVPHRSWTIREPFWFAVVIAIISTGLALLGNIWLSKKTDREQNQRDNLQDSLLKNLSSQQANYQKQLADSITTIRSDTTFLRK